MEYLDLSLPTPSENLACDEALLDECAEAQGQEVLRFWAPRESFVVLGYSSRIQSEVNLSCDSGIPVLRRCSGGGTVLQGPGCLNYALILKISEGGAFSSITQTNAVFMTKIRNALQPLVRGTMEIQGTSDLTVNGAKFCGNAQRRKKGFLLFHGVFLLQMNLDLIEKHLPVPAKQPRYRQNRAHKDFLVNLDLPAATIKQALRRQWNAHEERRAIPQARVERLVKNQYATQEWIYKF
jgi:lipoate-protein ligase A